MRANSFGVLSGVVAATSGVLCLLTWGLFWRPLAVLHPPLWTWMPPISGVAIGFAGLGILAWAENLPRSRVHWCAFAMAAIGMAILVEHIFQLDAGLEWWLFPGSVSAVLEGLHPGRPAPLFAMCLLLLAGAIVLGRGRRGGHFDPADVCAVAVLVASFTMVLGYLFQAHALVDVAARASDPAVYLPEAMLLMLLALGALSLNPDGVIATYGADDVGSAAKRRLLPAAILTPVLLGLVQAFALHAELLDPALAVALTAAAGILVSIVLIEWVSGLLSERQNQQEGELLQRESKALEEGMTDALTGLLNRRGWDQNLQQAEDHYQRQGGNACVIMIDLDGLKRINDTEGHAAGDLLIRRAGRALEAAARREDVVARLGGDEFVYLSNDCQPEHADVVLRRLAHSMEKANVPASMGYAMRDLAGSLQRAFQEADEAMYAHKRKRKAQRQTA